MTLSIDDLLALTPGARVVSGDGETYIAVGNGGFRDQFDDLTTARALAAIGEEWGLDLHSAPEGYSFLSTATLRRQPSGAAVTEGNATWLHSEMDNNRYHESETGQTRSVAELAHLGVWPDEDYDGGGW